MLERERATSEHLGGPGVLQAYVSALVPLVGSSRVRTRWGLCFPFVGPSYVFAACSGQRPFWDIKIGPCPSRLSYGLPEATASSTPKAYFSICRFRALFRDIPPLGGYLCHAEIPSAQSTLLLPLSGTLWVCHTRGLGVAVLRGSRRTRPTHSATAWQCEVEGWRSWVYIDTSDTLMGPSTTVGLAARGCAFARFVAEHQGDCRQRNATCVLL